MRSLSLPILLLLLLVPIVTSYEGTVSNTPEGLQRCFEAYVCPEGTMTIMTYQGPYRCCYIVPKKTEVCYKTPMCSMEECKPGYKRVKYIGCYFKGGESTCCPK